MMRSESVADSSIQVLKTLGVAPIQNSSVVVPLLPLLTS
jgi:hypothetical protein